jgi:acyl carrier protein
MKLKALLTESFGLKEGQYNDEQSIFDLDQFDSMNHMFFITNLEEKFAVELTGDEIVGIKTVKDIKDVLTAKSISEY